LGVHDCRAQFFRSFLVREIARQLLAIEHCEAIAMLRAARIGLI
jgi:hypothetical protein